VSDSVSSLIRFVPRPTVAPATGVPASVSWLRRHPLFASRDEEQVRSFLGSKNFAVEFPADAGHALDVRINGIYLPSMYLGHLTYGRALVLKATPQRSDYWLQFATQRRFDVDVAHEQLRCDAQTGAVLSPDRENVIRPEAGNGRLVLSISRDSIVRQLVALLGRPVTAPVQFAPSIALDRGYGRGLARHVRAAAEDLEEAEPLLRGAITQTSFEQFVITALLVSHPHNYSAELQRPDKRPAPRDVRRAIDYIQGHLTAPVTVEDIVRAAGVSGRVLFRHFRRSTGVSPMAYLRSARFQRVRDALRRARPEDHVVDIAALWGFDHIGRFAVEYRRRFGEKPSQTKASARASRATT
jgi:AraC-like DNA-binding protein